MAVAAPLRTYSSPSPASACAKRARASAARPGAAATSCPMAAAARIRTPQSPSPASACAKCGKSAGARVAHEQASCPIACTPPQRSELLSLVARPLHVGPSADPSCDAHLSARPATLHTACSARSLASFSTFPYSSTSTSRMAACSHATNLSLRWYCACTCSSVLCTGRPWLPARHSHSFTICSNSPKCCSPATSRGGVSSSCSRPSTVPRRCAFLHCLTASPIMKRNATPNRGWYLCCCRNCSRDVRWALSPERNQRAKARPAKYS